MASTSNPTISNSTQALLAFGGWKLHHVPQGWEFVEGFGLRNGFSSIGFQEEALPPGLSLQQYAEGQIQTVSSIAAGVHPEGPHVSSWRGAEEALDMGWRLAETENQYIIVQILAKSLGQVGIATFITTTADLAATAAVFRAVREKLEFRPDAPPATRAYPGLVDVSEEKASQTSDPQPSDSDSLNPS